MENWEKTKRTWVEIDLDALAHNFAEIRSRLRPGVKTCCVIKADGYGHGAVTIGHEYERLGADWFAVSNLEEAEELRHSGITRPILILGYTPAGCASRLARQNISQTVFSEEYARELSEAAVEAGVCVRIHIKVDTGMSRIGFFYQSPSRDQESLDAMERACRLPGLEPEGIFTHSAVADGGDDGRAYTLRQFETLMDAIQNLSKRGIHFSLRHCANSAAVEEYPEFQLDMVRCGIIQYGLTPSAQVMHTMELRPVMSLKSVISMIKTVEPGTNISYGRYFRAEKALRIATVPAGYADGYRRGFSAEGAYVKICGKPAPVVGRICMDQMMVDVTEIPEAKVGEEVLLFGEGLPVEELAEKEHTISYELVCGISRRVTRVYRKKGETVKVIRYLSDFNEE